MQSEVRSDSKLFRTLSRALLEQGISVRFRARGRSMFPAIADGDVVEVQPAQSHTKGDVLLIDNDDGLRVHRVVSSSERRIVTRGDSCDENDAPSETNESLGRVSQVFTRTGAHAPRTLRTRLQHLISTVYSGFSRLRSSL